MNNKFNCKYDSCEKFDYVNRFFEEEELRTLFIKISSIISENIQDLNLRGQEQKIIGVSQPGDRYIFYVVPCQDGYNIKFKNQDRTTFCAESSENLVDFAKAEISLIQEDPTAYRAMIPHRSSIKRGNKSGFSPVVPQFDIHAEIHDIIIRAGDTEGSHDVHLDQCQTFCEQLESCVTQLTMDIPKLSDRVRDMYISRTVHGETLSQVGERFSITRERVRQICMRTNRRIIARVRRFPDENILNDLLRFDDILKEVSENELYTLMNYVIEKRKLMFELLFALFISSDEQPTLIQKIENAERPVEERLIPVRKEKTSQKTPRIPAVPTGRYCPRCGAELLVQTVKRGQNAGSRFVGCSAFPRCWYSEKLSLAEADALGIIGVIIKN